MTNTDSIALTAGVAVKRAGVACLRVLLVERQPIVMHGLQVLLDAQGDMEVVGAQSDLSHLPTVAAACAPDVVMVNLQASDEGMAGLKLAMQSLRVPVRWIVFAQELGDDDALDLVRLGVKGVLLQDMPLNLIVQCVRRVGEGGEWIERRSMTQALGLILRREVEFQDVKRMLSPRELELALLVAKGMPNKVAASALGLTEGSVRVYLNRIYNKLQVPNRLALALHMRDRGLVAV